MKKIFALASLLTSAALFAHPHVWIDVTVTPQTDNQGHLIALHEHWLFDPIYAEMLLEGVERATTDSARAALWQHLQQDLATNLAAEHFYTRADIALQKGENPQLREENGQLTFNVTLPLSKASASLRYQIYEREYFIQILHSSAQPKQFANGCTLRITPATPAPEQIAAAAALDRNQKSPTPLGQFFAETGVMSCH